MNALLEAVAIVISSKGTQKKQKTLSSRTEANKARGLVESGDE